MMYEAYEPQENGGYDVLDCCYGTVKDRNRKGAYLVLDNGEEAFAFKFANLLPGTKVLCTVQKPAREGRMKQVSIDSVRYDPARTYM